ncbi:MAG: hypothetical protein MJE63_07280 [Proteobacteria bacterium]|nr:hypothetical protein [Pseudomonadota bacterium]
MKKLVIPTIKSNEPDSQNERPDRMIFTGDYGTCGGDIHCSGRRIVENWCNALAEKKGYRGLDNRCTMTMIKVQLDALNALLGIQKGSPDRQKIRAEDVDIILEEVRQENRICIGNNEPELNRMEAFNLVTDLLLEHLHVTKELNNRFFGMMLDSPETKSFKDLDPQLIQKLKSAMSRSANLLFKNESEM